MAKLIHLSAESGGPEYELKGYTAYDGGGEKLGKVESVIADEETREPRYLVIDSGGWFSSKQFVVPIGDIERVEDAERMVVFARLTREMLGSGAYPRYDESWWQNNEDQQFGAHEREIARAYEPGRTADQPVDYTGDLYRKREWTGDQRLQLREERLVPQTQPYEAGAVRISKRVVTRTETIEVPLRDEYLVIERLPGEGRVLIGDRELKEGETVEITLRLERAAATREQVVHEEVRIRKEQVQRTEQVQDTVRREELVVNDPTGNLVDQRATTAADRSQSDRPESAGRPGTAQVGTETSNDRAGRGQTQR